MSQFDSKSFQHKQTGNDTSVDQRWLETFQPLPDFPTMDSSLLRIKDELLPSNPDDPMSQLVNAWISSATNDTYTNDGAHARRQRRFLETHSALLHPHSDEVLYEVMARTSGNASMVDVLGKHLRVLHQARTNGGTVEAIRQAYVNVYGGLALDLSVWLEEATQQLIALEQGQPYKTAQTRVEFLRQCIARVESDPSNPVEAGAELHKYLGVALRSILEVGRQDAFESAIASLQAALQIYAYHNYPEQYALVQRQLGNVYSYYFVRNREENFEKAIQCFESALSVHTRAEFPADWATLHSHLGNVYALLERGGKAENRERATHHYELALQELGMDIYVETWADTQLNLGTLYLEYTGSERAKNLERAMQCFNAALRYFTREEHAEMWATAQNHLGIVYLQRPMGERSMNIERAIYCFQASLRVVTRETLPMEWIEAQKGLGDAYLKREQGRPAENIEKAIEHLTLVRNAVDPIDMRVKRLKILNDLGEAYRKRVLGERQENLQQARECHQVVLRTLPPDRAQYQRAQLNLAYLATLPK